MPYAIILSKNHVTLFLNAFKFSNFPKILLFCCLILTVPISYLFSHFSCGPIFGAGADLLISNDCNTNADSYSNLPHSYDGENASNTILMGVYNFTVLDYEVFTPVTKWNIFFSCLLSCLVCKFQFFKLFLCFEVAINSRIISIR